MRQPHKTHTVKTDGKRGLESRRREGGERAPSIPSRERFSRRKEASRNSGNQELVTGNQWKSN